MYAALSLLSYCIPRTLSPTRVHKVLTVLHTGISRIEKEKRSSSLSRTSSNITRTLLTRNTGTLPHVDTVTRRDELTEAHSLRAYIPAPMKCWHYAALKAQLAHMTALIATTAAATSHLTDGAAARHGKGLKRTRAVGLKRLKPTLELSSSQRLS